MFEYLRMYNHHVHTAGCVSERERVFSCVFACVCVRECVVFVCVRVCVREREREHESL